LVISVVSLSNPASATTPVTTATYLLYAGHGIGVTGTYDLNTGCSEVFLTKDFAHWQNVTPLLKKLNKMPRNQCAYVWTYAYFTSSSDGWLMARDGGGTNTLLRHTTNGGRTWATQPSGDTGSTAGFETMTFVNGRIGWRQQFGMGSNGDYALERTLNGGATWSTRSSDPRGWCPFTNEVFSSASLGFAFANFTSDSNPTRLLRTEDGGVSWSTMRLPPPPSLPSGSRGLYGEPVFSGNSGVEPVDYPVNGRQLIYLYVTGDGGVTWKLDAKTHLPIVVSGALTFNGHDESQGCNVDTAAVSGPAAMITSASPATWWVFTPGPKGATSLVVADGAGAQTALTVKDLPKTTDQMAVAASNSRDALLTLPIPYGYQTTYETSNGGVSWEKVTLPTPN
jgi:photosystem II stability/assembly factor-like uncharacterized protein